MKESLNNSYEWYKNHPYVKIWRGLNTNSYSGVIQKIKEDWNTTPEYSIKYSNVSVIIDEYLKYLKSHIKYTIQNEGNNTYKRGLGYFKDRFDLTDAESKIIYSQLYNN